MAISNYNLAHSQNEVLTFNDFVNNKHLFQQTAATIRYFEQLFVPHKEIARLINCKLSDFKDLYLMVNASSPSDYSKTGKFSQRDQKLILLLHKTGKSLEEISQILNCSRGQASWQIHESFLSYESDRDPLTPLNSDDLEAAEHLAFLDVPVEQVAKQLKCSEKEAKRAIEEVFLNYSSKREKETDLWLHDRIVLEHLIQTGISQRKTLKRLNCSPSTITYELKRCPENEYNAYAAQNDYVLKLHQKRGYYKTEQTQDFLEAFKEEFNEQKYSPESFAYYHYVRTDSPFMILPNACDLKPFINISMNMLPALTGSA